jgi:ABC-type branched-subunit amino acid transport system permease subunit
MSDDRSVSAPAADATDVTDDGLTVSVVGRSIPLKTALGGLCIALLLISPAVLPGYIVAILALSLVFSVFALSVDLLWGYTGILTFGHAVFLGLGAYLMGILLQTVGTGPTMVYVGIVAGTILPGFIGLIIAGILFYRGIGEDYFTIITLALAIIGNQIAVSWSSVTNGANGLLIPSAEIGIPVVFSVPLSETLFYYICVFVIVAAYLFSRRVIDSPFGRTLIAINENETKAASIGYNAEKYKTMIFGLSSAMAGFAGTLYVLLEGFISPPLLGFQQSTDVLIWVLVGGRGTLIGGIIGTVFLRFFENTISGALAFSWIFVLGIVLILIVLLFPRGIAGLFDIARDRLAERSNRDATDTDGDQR